ncbi:MAG: hypothetical protein ACOY0T_17475 [Myxococcota bacterium]
MFRFKSYWLLMLALAGCGDPVKRVELIEEPRVLAARAEVVGAPERATPGPGETLQVRWLVAAPEGDPPSGFALSACSTPKHNRGVLRCESAPFASDIADANAANPVFEFVVPGDLDATAKPRIAILGSVCAQGAGRIDGNAAGCGSGTELPVSLDLFLAGSETTNSNPSLPSDAIELDDGRWNPGDLPNGACSGLGLPEVSRAGGHHQIRITLPESARENLIQRESTDAPREELRISHFANAGELTRAFSEVLPSDAQTSVTLDWEPPKTAPVEGQLVRFWFVVRDLRGGSDFTERSLCLVP